MTSSKSRRRAHLSVKVLVEPMNGTCRFAFTDSPRTLDPMVWRRVSTSDAAALEYGRKDANIDVLPKQPLSQSPVKMQSPPSELHDTYAHSKHKRLGKPKKRLKKLKHSASPTQQPKVDKPIPMKSTSPAKVNKSEVAVTFSDKEKASFSSILSDNGTPALPPPGPTANRQSIQDFELIYEKRCRENDRRQIEDMWKWMTLLLAFAVLFLVRGEVIAVSCSLH